MWWIASLRSAQKYTPTIFLFLPLGKNSTIFIIYYFLFIIY